MTRAEQRLIHERRLWRLGHPHDLHARPQVLNGGVDLFTWECSILGRKGTYLEGRMHKLLLRFPRNYPYSQPIVCFTSPIFHPYAIKGGFVCIEFNWSPELNICQILQALRVFIEYPSTSYFLDALNKEALSVFVSDKKRYWRMAQETALPFGT